MGRENSVTLPRYNPAYWERCWVLKVFPDRSCLTCPMPECWYDKRYYKRWQQWDTIEEIGSSGLSLEDCIKKFRKDFPPRTVKHYLDLYHKHKGNRMNFMSRVR